MQGPSSSNTLQFSQWLETEEQSSRTKVGLEDEVGNTAHLFVQE